MTGNNSKKSSPGKKGPFQRASSDLTPQEQVQLQSSMTELKHEINLVFKDMFEETVQQLEDLNAENRLIKKRMRKLESLYLPRDPEDQPPTQKYPKSPDHCYT